MAEDLYPLTCCGDLRGTDQFRDSLWLFATMVGVLRQHFGADERMTLGRSTFKWSPVANDSKLVVDTADNLDFKEGEKFPRLLVDLETQGFQKDFVGDLAGFNIDDGGEIFSTRMESAYSIEVWTTTKIETWALADEVRIFFQTFRRQIACKYGFQFLRPAQVIKPVKSKIYTDYWVSRVIIAYELSDSWGISQESLKASIIQLNLSPS